MPALPLDNRYRVLLLAFPAVRDVLTLAIESTGLACHPCETMAETLVALQDEAALLVVTTDLLREADIETLAGWCHRQPLWSTLPLILLVPDPDQPAAGRIAEKLGPATLLPDTCSRRWLQTAIKSAWMARRRQYELSGSADPQSEGIVRSAVEAAEIGIWDYLPETGLVHADANCHQMLGIDPVLPFDLQRFYAVVHPDDRARVEAAIAATLEPGGTGEYELDYRACHADGKIRWLTASGKAGFAEGRLASFTGILRDRSKRRLYEDGLLALNETLEEKVAERTARLQQEVAERRKAQEQLQQSQKMEAIGQLTGGIAHDFNNLLGAVMGNLELLRSRLSDPKLLRFVENALQAVNRGARLTTQLLSFSRLRAVSLKPVDINAVIRGLDELLSHTLGPGIVIETVLAPALPPVLTDSNQFELALLNLAINARDAMQNTGRLTIRTEILAQASPCVAIAVSDTGCGMAPDILAQVFEPFFTTKETGKGTGLGLSQVQGMVRQCGGQVDIASQPGQGTTVTMILPQAEGTVLPVPPILNGPDLLPTGQNQKVLVVEDDADVSSFIGDSLQMLGYQPILAADGLAGLGLLATEEPAAAIVDYAMPGMNGAEWVQHARRLRPDLVIVFATGHVQVDILQAACPTAPLLRKPFRIGTLAAALDQALKQEADPTAEIPAAPRDRSA